MTGIAGAIWGLAVGGCTQTVPPGTSNPVQFESAPTASAGPLRNANMSKPLSAVELQESLAEEAQLLQRIEVAIGNDRCTSDADCTTIPIGEKACGGPERWLACTHVSAQKAPIPALLSQLIAMQRTRAARSGMLSNCLISPDPGAMCRANRCVLRSPGGAV